MSDFQDLKDVITVSELAEFLGVSRITLVRWEKAGKIKPIRINSRGDRRYLKSNIIEFAKLRKF